MTVKISIIIPAFNSSEFLPTTIESVLAQTFNDFELLIIDDGSTDNTAEVVSHYCKLDSRIKLVSQNNQGVSKARNTGIEIAKGEYIAFLDSDDQWLPNKLAIHMQHFNECSNLGISFAKIEFMSFDGQPTGKCSNSQLFQLTPKHLYYENLIVTPSNAVIRRAVINNVGSFDSNLSGTEDAELFFRVAYKGWKIEGINQVLVRYRTNQMGVSSNLRRMEEDWKKFNAKVETYAPELVNQHYHQAKAFFLRSLARRTLRNQLSSQMGVNFINRALTADWKMIFREPKRTILTIIAVYARHIIPN